ncbi:MAG TPA: hypothetical protein VFW11_22515 [Cyclobacteriaceae bacterium]|nr:hypothetical protein [Cyclobacteriaceae bacterium]
MNPETKDRADLLIRAIGPALVLAGIIVGIIQFKQNATADRTARNGQYNMTLAQAQREAKKPFYERQFSLYLEAADVTSRIANPINEDDRGKAVARFWQLYWGQLAVVESAEVATAMVHFKEVLENDALTGDARRTELSLKAYELAHQCRDSFIDSWKVETEEIRSIIAPEEE